MKPTILSKDIEEIYQALTKQEKNSLFGRTILVTGFAGSLGYMLCQFFAYMGKEIGIKKVYCLDNYVFGQPYWIEALRENELFEIVEGDVVRCDLSFAKDADLIFHMASLASPVYYRLHPIETMDADVIGLRRLLEFFEDKSIYNLLFYSTSEIYGNPDPKMIPTPENYFGNVNPAGPRACYDESKRFGETLCYNFHLEKEIPVTVIRPFNSFGPGLRLNDKRVVADFAQNIVKKEDITIYSDGTATRTFCYVTDTIIACLKSILYGKYDIFNIGMDSEEITVLQLAEIYKELGEGHFGYTGKIVYKTHSDKHYLTDNPQRRCPDISKARQLLGYMPKVKTTEGVFRYLTHVVEANEIV